MSLRKLFAAPALPVGHLLFEFATPGIGYMARNAGCDYLILDLEHSGFGFETAKHVVTACRAAGIPLVLRVPSHDAKDLARACDIGADGVMVPLVHSAAQARAIVAAVKYVPDGQRGIGMVQMHDRYLAGPVEEKLRSANATLAVILQIESREGATDADAMAAIDGVDCLWIGHMDLSCSLGMPGRFDTEAFRGAERSVIDATRRHGKRCGRLARTAEEALALAGAGYDCMAIATDTALYQAALGKGIADFRSGLAGVAR